MKWKLISPPPRVLFPQHVRSLIRLIRSNSSLRALRTMEKYKQGFNFSLLKDLQNGRKDNNKFKSFSIKLDFSLFSTFLSLFPINFSTFTKDYALPMKPHCSIIVGWVSISHFLRHDWKVLTFFMERDSHWRPTCMLSSLHFFLLQSFCILSENSWQIVMRKIGNACTMCTVALQHWKKFILNSRVFLFDFMSF